MYRYLIHYGIKGQKWGVRRFQNKDGSLTPSGMMRYNKKARELTIKKGKKYFSITRKDNEKWKNLFKEVDQEDYDLTYVATKDLKIAPYTKVGELYAKDCLNGLKQITIQDTFKALNFLGYKNEDDYDALFTNFAAQTQTGKRYVQELMNMGYDGVEDYHGRNVSREPIIIFDPDSKVKKTNSNRFN